jgi:hydroxymethylbilane synthase
MNRLRLGTRGSALARWQAQWVADELMRRGVEIELVLITTQGDVSQRDPIASVGGIGVFTKELQRALVDARIDLAVHSLKDLPTESVPGLALSAVCEREIASDVLVSRRGTLAELPSGAVVGTGSLRRQSQLLHARSDLSVRNIRGNVDTRLARLAAGEYDAIVLAYAGLKRLGFEDRITQVFDRAILMPAVGQGALGIETRADDQVTRTLLDPLDHRPTHRAVVAERSLLAALGGGCLAPIGAWAHEGDDGTFEMEAVVLSTDGSRRLAAAGRASAEQSLALAADLAQQLLAQGASALIAQSRPQG